MARPITIWPAPVLLTPTQPVTAFDESLARLIEEMHEAMVEAEGIGIAATQIGVGLRLAIVGREDGTWFEIVNPQIVEKSEPITLEEGCLSVPGEWELVPRFRKVRVKWQDKTGAWHEEAAEDKLAHVFQHEIDHLDGTVYVKYLSQLKRNLIKKRLEKRARHEARAAKEDAEKGEGESKA